MLSSLHIRNLALVQELDLELSTGLNTVTGETGAGKSLVIGAIQWLAGARASGGAIRKGEKSCEVSAVLRIPEEYGTLMEKWRTFAAENGIPNGDDERELLLRRVVTENGSRAFINGAAVTVALLKECGEWFFDIHGPHDNQGLLQPLRQLELLDSYAGTVELAAACAACHGRLQETKAEIARLRQEGLAPEDQALLAHQLREIEDAALQPDEEKELIARHRVASNARRVLDICQSLRNGLCDGENSLQEQISALLRQLHELAQIDPKAGNDFTEMLEGIYEQVQEAAVSVSDYGENLELDEEELRSLEERMDLIARLKRKYGGSVEEVIATGRRLRSRLEAAKNMGGRLTELRDTVKQLETELRERCGDLTTRRRAQADRLAAAITAKLLHLGFAKAVFAIQMEAAEPGPHGADAVEFLFAPNAGEDSQPLRAIASSGEIARVMLALKTVLRDADPVPVLVFDEIDANVGGRVAVAVAEELTAVGEHHQVFCITHLPQIAAAGRQHYRVSKSVHDGRTFTQVSLLQGDSRLSELVRMLGADEGSPAATEHARSLLKAAAHKEHDKGEKNG